MRTWHKSLIGVGLGVVLGPAVLSILVTPTRAQPPSRVEVNEPVATKWTVSPAVDPSANRHAAGRAQAPAWHSRLLAPIDLAFLRLCPCLIGSSGRAGISEFLTLRPKGTCSST